MIEKGSQVKLHYTLTVDDQVVDSSFDRDPIAYVHGQGQIVPGLEEQLEGLEAGDKKVTSEIPPEKGYGPRRPDALQKVAKTAFEDPTQLAQGNLVSGQVQGRPFQARVAEVSAESVTLDMNHPLAGKTLQFEVEIVEVN